MSSARQLHPIWLVAAAVLATLAACSDADVTPGAHPAPGRGVYVGEVWQTARKVSGHQVHVLGEKIACAKCHELTSDSIGAVTPERCGACHAKEVRIEHAAAQAQQRFGSQVKADCTTCHAFTREGTGHEPADGGPHAATDCKHCHLEQQGPIPGVKVHGSGECVNCHQPHEHDKPTSAPCSDCHRDIVPTHAVGGRSNVEVCRTCHQHQHAPASDARPTCATCHATQKPVVPATALFPEGHLECVGCHRPHEFAKTSAVRCRSCHEDVVVLGAPRVRQHAECTSCHAAHDVKGSPDRACARCHTDKHSDHPKHGVAGTCVGCHDPHPPSAQSPSRLRNCSSCHQIAGSEKGFHGGTACKQCHTPHDFVRPASDRSACKACHGKELSLVAALGGHQACEGCHGGLPHRPTTLGAGCETCHARQRQEVTQGHSACTKCHEPHGGSSAASCKSCHQKEHQSAPAGHQDCRRCHDAHSGSTSTVACATCHAAEAKSEHGALGRGCTTCHRAHGPEGPASPPACTTCHRTPALPGLHQEAKHQNCMRCHTGHGERAPSSERGACLSCHVERKNHFPDAPRCTSCHLFDKSR